jgi:hypothetical protein
MESNQYYWFKQKDNKVYEYLFNLIKHLDTEQSYRRQENFRNMRLYGNYDFSNLRTYQYFKAESSASIQNRITLNIVQSMIDTVVSKVTKNKPRPMFLTSGGDFVQQRKAQKLTQFVEGVFYKNDFYSKTATAFLDACIFGTGAIKFYTENGEVKTERVFINEIEVDDNESFYGKPRQLIQKKYIHKDVLKEMFPGKEAAIDAAAQDTVTHLYNNLKTNSDMILVAEAWKLPSTKESKDGKHAITISTATLFSEEYEKDYFPFIFFRWGTRPLGFFGQGLAEQLSGLQLEINKILRTIQVSMHLVSVPKIFVQRGSKIVTAHLDNKIGGIIEYDGQAPIPGQMGQVPSELFAHLDRLYQRAYEIAGVSQLSAQSAKPAGLNSGKAMRVYNDLESERFLSVMMRYEKEFLNAAHIMCDMAKDIADSEGDYTVKVPGKNFLKTINFKDIDLHEDDYVMQLFPTSALSNDPASRLEDVQDLISAGFVSREDAIKLLDFPDLKSFYNFQTSAGEDISRTIEKFIDEGAYETPEPYQNLQYGIDKMQQAYLYYKSQSAPEENLELFRRWIEDARGLLERAAIESQRQQMEAEQQMALMAQQQAAQSPAGEAMAEQQMAAQDEAAMADQEAAAMEEQQVIDESMIPQ